MFQFVKKFTFKKTSNKVSTEACKSGGDSPVSTLCTISPLNQQDAPHTSPGKVSGEQFKSPSPVRTHLKTPTSLRSRLLRKSTVTAEENSPVISSSTNVLSPFTDYDPPTDMDTDISVIVDEPDEYPCGVDRRESSKQDSAVASTDKVSLYIT